MYEINVYIVRIEASQAVFRRRQNVMTRQPLMKQCRAAAEADFRRDLDIFSPCPQGFFQKLLGLAPRINIGGIKMIDTGVERLAHKLICKLLIDPRYGLEHGSFSRTEGHGSECEP